MSARKIGLLLLLLGAGFAIEATWSVERHLGFGPQGCRVLGGRFYGPSWTFEDEAREAFPAGARLELENAFGTVRIVPGEPGALVVHVRKVVYLPTEEKAREFADRLKLRTEVAGDRVRVKTNRDEVGRDDRVGFETHLDIRVPPATAVIVKNEHGRVELREVASAEVDASHDGVEIERVTGAVGVKSRHGDVKVSEVGGDLTLDARHGDVEVEGVKGQVRLSVQHGQVSAKRTGALTLEHSHGGIHVEGVTGDLVVKAQHAGVEAEDVTGNATVETSFDHVTVARVGGAARLTANHGAVKASGVQGELTAEASFDHVELDDVGGPIEVSVEHGGVQVDGVRKGGRVRASGDDVSVSAFEGALEVDAQRGNVHLSPGGPITERVTVKSARGEIRLEVPPGSRFDFEARSRRGEVRADVPGLAVTESGERRLIGKMAGGGNAVSLAAEGDIDIEARSTSAHNQH